MIENTNAGLDAVRVRVKSGGRPKNLAEKKAQLARELRKDRSCTVNETRAVLKMSRATFYNYSQRK